MPYLRDHSKWFLIMGSINMFLCVALGAFGAHGLKASLPPDLMAIYHTGNQYHFYHSLGLFAVTLASGFFPGSRLIGWSGGFILAVGGGSVLDAAKFIAAAVPFEGDTWDILLKGGRNIDKALPFGTVLTLPATGSEMNNGSVITRRDIGAKLAFRSRHLFPVFSVLDPTKTYTLPVKQLANGVVDAFVHTVEQYLTYPVNAPVQDRFAEGLLQTLIEIGPRLLAAPEPVYDDRANLMWTATLALNGLIGAGVPQDWATHMIGHELTAQHNIDHARTLAIVLPALLNERRVQKRDKLLQYGARVWGITSGTIDERITAAIDQTRDFFERMGIPTHLSAYGLGADAIDLLVAQLEAHGMTKLSEHGDLTIDVSRRILEAAL